MKKVAQIILILAIMLAGGHLINSALGCDPTQPACQPDSGVRHPEEPKPIEFRP
jgi:hypothetical protein